MPKKYNKYFIIGFNKTGTNTLHQLFLKNNLKSQHSGKWRLEQYQCFSDSEDIFRFEDLDKQYENSIFILNTRSLQKWIISRFKHGLRKKKKPNWAYPPTQEKALRWISERESLHVRLLKYFSKDPNKLIIINIEKEGWIKYLCSQLDFKNDTIETQNEIITDLDDRRHQEIIQIVNSSFEKINCQKNTLLSENLELVTEYLELFRNYI